jgi:hypothetical protein
VVFVGLLAEVLQRFLFMYASGRSDLFICYLLSCMSTSVEFLKF